MKYIAPELEVMAVLAVDVITTSSNKTGNENGDTFTPDEEL